MSTNALIHPVCHISNGSRLYYILLRFTVYENLQKNVFGRLLNKVGLMESTAAFLVFGETDAVVRVWAPINKISDLVDCIHSDLPVVPDQTRLLRINQMETWYQRSLERNEGWDSGVVLRNLSSILEGNPPKGLQLRVQRDKAVTPEEETPTPPIRFFMFINTAETMSSALFDWLGQQAMDSLFGGSERVQNVSFYSYVSETSEGVLIKGNLPPSRFSLAGEKVVKFLHSLRQFGVSATTYIAAKEMSNTNDRLPPKYSYGHDKARYHDILTNLLFNGVPVIKSSSASLMNSGRSFHSRRDLLERRRRRFVQLCEEIFDWFWIYDETWWDRISRVQELLDYVLHGEEQNDQLSGVMLRGISLIESQLHDLFTKHKIKASTIESKIDSFRRVLSKHKEISLPPSVSNLVVVQALKLLPIPKELTLEPMISELRNLLERFGSKLRGEFDEKIIRDFVSTIAKAQETRNQLAHGRLKLLNQLGATKTEAWEDHVIPYARLILLAEPARASIDRLLEVASHSLAKTPG